MIVEHVVFWFVFKAPFIKAATDSFVVFIIISL